MRRRRRERLVAFAIRSMMPGTPGVDDFVGRLSREASWPMWGALIGASGAFVALPVLTIGVPLPAHRLSPARLDAHAAKMASHPVYLVRQSAFAIKMAGGLCWGADPRVREDIGLAPYADDPGTWRTT